jgi:NAD-dependent DNA ligase
LVIPPDFTCLSKFIFQPRVRLFASKLEDRPRENKTNDEAEKASVKSKQPLFRLNFASCGKLVKNNQQIKAIIERLGGKFKSECTAETVALISNEGRLGRKMTHQIHKLFIKILIK